MDHAFERLQIIEADWPLPSPNGKMYYDELYEQFNRCIKPQSIMSVYHVHALIIHPLLE